MHLNSPPPKIVVGTSNKGKFLEIGRYAEGAGLSVLALEEVARERGPAPRVAETGISIEENVELKARAYATWCGFPVLVDDTGLFLDRLGGFPGVYTADWGLARVVAALGPSRSSTGAFRCRMAFAEPAGRVVSVEGEVKGDFRFEPKVSVPSGAPLPFSFFFWPAGSELSLATLSQGGYADSHRARAFATLIQVLGWSSAVSPPNSP